MSKKLFYLLAVTASFSAFNLYADQNCDSCILEEQTPMEDEIQQLIYEAEEMGVSREEILELIKDEINL